MDWSSGRRTAEESCGRRPPCPGRGPGSGVGPNPAPRHLRNPCDAAWLYLQPLAALAGVCLALALVRTCAPVAWAVGEFRAVGPAASALAWLEVRPEESGMTESHGSPGLPGLSGWVGLPREASTASSGSPSGSSSGQGGRSAYSRDVFGYQQTDEDGDGCPIREDVLARDLTRVRFRAGTCVVLSGRLRDPYTGRTIDFTRGRTTSSVVQIDHVVALHDAWRSGADRWSSDELTRYGNDPYNLLAVDGPANQEKSDSSAADWLPSNASFRCEYVARQIGIKRKYGLSVTSREREAMRQVLHGCPGQPVPSEESTRLKATAQGRT